MSTSAHAPYSRTCFPGAEVIVGDAALVAISGRLDFTTADASAARLMELLDQGCRSLVLDTTGLWLCDPCGLAALVRVADQAEAAGGRLLLTGTPAPLVRLLAETGLLGRLTG